MIIKSRKLLYDSEGYINTKLIEKTIDEHCDEIKRFEMLEDYYNGKHSILNRTKRVKSASNNKLVINHAKDIVDFFQGYVFSKPVTYYNLEEQILDCYTLIDEDSHNTEMSLSMGIYGKAYELIYLDEIDGKMIPQLVTLNPKDTFVVYDTSYQQKPMFGVTYFANRNIENDIINYTVMVYTEDMILTYETAGNTLRNSPLTLVDIEEHYFGQVPILRVVNNKMEQSDFEGVVTLIDAYNKLQSDRINDKEQFVQALLIIVNASLGDTEEERSETAKWIRQEGMLELDSDGNAFYLNKQLNEQDVEILSTKILKDIYRMARVPNMSDENFAGNSSGVAMAYKLLGTDQVGLQKERQFKKLLRDRLSLIVKVNGILTGSNTDLTKVDIHMDRNIPRDLDTAIKELQATEGIFPTKYRMSKFDPECDAEELMKELMEEKLSNAKVMNEAYGNFNFPVENQPLNKATEEDKKMKEDTEEEDTEDNKKTNR